MLLPLTGSLPQTCLSGVNLDKVLVRCFVLLSVTSCYHSYCIVWRVFVLVRNQFVTVLEGVVLELPPYSCSRPESDNRNLSASQRAGVARI